MVLDNNLELICRPEWSMNSFAVHIIQRANDGRPASAAQPLTMEVVDGTSVVAPTFYLSRMHAQSLMDSLYSAGVRPTEARHVNETLTATKEHIADLRKVAFTLLENAAPERPA